MLGDFLPIPNAEYLPFADACMAFKLVVCIPPLLIGLFLLVFSHIYSPFQHLLQAYHIARNKNNQRGLNIR